MSLWVHTLSLSQYERIIFLIDMTSVKKMSKEFRVLFFALNAFILLNRINLLFHFIFFFLFFIHFITDLQLVSFLFLVEMMIGGIIIVGESVQFVCVLRRAQENKTRKGKKTSIIWMS